MDPRHLQLIKIISILFKYIEGAPGKDADENAIIQAVLAACETKISELIPEPITGPQGEAGKDGEQGPQGEVGPAGPQGEAGKDGKNPSREELLQMLAGLIPEPQETDIAVIEAVVKELLPDTDAQTQTIQVNVTEYVTQVMQQMRNDISARTYDATEIVGLAEFVANNSGESSPAWEKIGKNHASWPNTLTYNSDGDIDKITYSTDNGDIVATHSYNPIGDVTQIVLSGAVPIGIPTTKRFFYTGDEVTARLYT